MDSKLPKRCVECPKQLPTCVGCADDEICAITFEGCDTCPTARCVKQTQTPASVYHLTRPELLDLLAVAEGLLAATGNAVALCPTYARPTTSDPITKESAR